MAVGHIFCFCFCNLFKDQKYIYAMGFCPPKKAGPNLAKNYLPSNITFLQKTAGYKLTG